MLLVCYVSVPLAILRGERTKAATRSSLIPDGNRGGPAPVRTASTFSRLRMFDSSVLKVLFAEAWTETLERIEKAFFSDFDGDLNSPAEAAAYHQVVKDIQTELERSSKAFANTSSKSNINTSSKSNREYLSANARTRQLGTRTQLPSHDEIHDIDVGVNTDDTNNADDNNDNDNGLKSGSHKNTAVMKSNDTTPLTASASSVHHLESQSKSKSESGFGAPARRPGQERQQSVLSTGIPEGVEGDGDDEKEKDEKEGNEDEGKGREETLREGDEKEDQDDDDDDNEGERVKGKEEGGAGDRDHYGGSYIESRGNREKKDDSDDGEDDEDKDNKKKISDYKDSCNNDSNDRDNDDKDSDMVEYIPHPPEERRARTESKENSRNKNERKNSSKNTDEDDIVPVDTANVPKRPGRKLIVP